MRLGLIVALSSALFKSYFRSSSQRASVSFFSKPKVMLAIDVALFGAPAIALQFVIGALPSDINIALAPLLAQGIISMPLLMTSAVIIAGLMFELGQGSAVSPSEAVNWWPVSSREYVAASALSTSSLYSAFLALAAGITLPLAIEFKLFFAWPVMMLLSAFSLLLGAFIVEFLKAITNRVSSVAYKKSGRLTLAVRLVALILLFAIIQLAFQPFVLSWFFGKIVAGIEVIWMAPFVWPSAAMASLLGQEAIQTALYTLLSLFFTIVLYESASRLRHRYWSTVPISISIDESTTYVPKGSISRGFGFSSFASLLALKEFRALTRRKDLARYIAIPVMLVVSFLATTVVRPIDASGIAPGFYLIAISMPLIVPLMFSSISIGHEGNSITNLLSLPMKPTDLIKGKLAPAWLISIIATFGGITAVELIAPLGLLEFLSTIAVSAMAVFINSFIGLGVGSRWPDFTVGAKSRYISIKGYIVGFAFSGLAILTVYAPVGIYLVSSESVRGEVPFFGLNLPLMLATSTVLGSVLIVLSYIFCKRGVENLLTNA